MAKAKKETRGGYRDNARRPLKYGEKTVPVVVRVPESKVSIFKKLIQPILDKWLKK